MKNILVLILAFAAVSVAHAQSYSQPESVEYDASGSRYFISNPGAGNILQRDGSGTLTVFTSLPSSPHGLHISGNTLYVCDGASLKGYDLASASEVMNINLGATFLNGLTGDGGSNLYVTDFTAKKIYHVDIPSQTFNVFVTGLTKSPNGIFYDGANSRLLFVSWGSNAPIMQVNLADSVTTQVASTSLTNCDGITRDSQGNYYVTAWGTQSMYKFDNTFSSVPVQFTTGLNNPADICYNAAGDTIAIPNAGNNTVMFVWLNSAGVGIDERVQKNIEAYPVPSDDKVTISLDRDANGIVYTLFDACGKLIEERASFCQDKQVVISLEDLPAGVYYVNLRMGDELIVKKLVKK